jgi:hypothetical protein
MHIAGYVFSQLYIEIGEPAFGGDDAKTDEIQPSID